jgi:hypothetical protein
MTTVYKIKRKQVILGSTIPLMYHTNIFYKIYNQVESEGSWWEWINDADGNIKEKSAEISCTKIERVLEGGIRQATMQSLDRPATDREVRVYMDTLLGIQND